MRDIPVSMESSEHHVCGVQGVDKVRRHGVLLFPGVRRVGGVPAHPHIQSLELSGHLHRGE